MFHGINIHHMNRLVKTFKFSVETPA